MSESNEKIDRYDGKDFGLWSYRMQMILREKDLWTYVQREIKIDSDDEDEDEVSEKDRVRAGKALSIIVKGLDNVHLSTIRGSKSAYEAWVKLKESEQPKSITNILVLRQTLYSMKMNKHEKIRQFVNRMRSTVSSLEAAGKIIEESELILILLNGLPDNFKQFASTLHGMLLEYRFDDIVNKLVEYELFKLNNQDIREQNKSYKDQVMLTTMNEKSNNGNATTSQVSKRKGRCRTCNELGHWSRDCSKFKNDFHQVKKNQKANNGRDYRSHKGNDSETAMSLLTLSHGTDSWLIDSGATRHCTNDRSIMFDYREIIPIDLYIADGRSLTAIGIGSVKLLMNLGNGKTTKVNLTNVHYFPKLARNLFSLKSATDKGIDYYGDNEEIHFFKDNQLVGRGISQSTKLYYLDCQVILPENECHAIFQPDDDVWHNRSNHTNNLKLKQTVEGNLGIGIHLKKDDLIVDNCEVFDITKVTRPIFSHQSERTKSKLDLAHLDLVEQMNISESGYRFFEGKPMKRLQTDSTKELVAKKMGLLLEQNGVHPEESVSYCHEQNSIVKCYIRTFKKSSDEKSNDFDVAMMMNNSKSFSHKEALSRQDSKQWLKSKSEGINVMKKNATWELIGRPPDKNCHITNDDVILRYCPTDDMVADIFIKFCKLICIADDIDSI